MLHNFGQWRLRRVFFLRAVIEQFARRQAGLSEVMVAGDQIMDVYAGTIPLRYREVIPSQSGVE